MDQINGSVGLSGLAKASGIQYIGVFNMRHTVFL